MYNRYVPQPDGSHKRSRMAEPKRSIPPTPQRQTPPPPPCPAPIQEPPKPDKKECPRSLVRQSSTGLGSFFRQLLPKELDTGDLLILLLLLLMAGDQEEDKNNALLTMALYFLM